jgi:hypothetical protein
VEKSGEKKLRVAQVIRGLHFSARYSTYSLWVFFVNTSADMNIERITLFYFIFLLFKIRRLQCY